jgi:hypothetical protein
VAVGVGEVPDLVDDQERGSGVVSQASAQSGGAVDGGQVAEKLAGVGEQGGVSVEDGLVGDVASERGLSHAIGSDQDGVGGVADKVEPHQRLDGLAITAGRP